MSLQNALLTPPGTPPHKILPPYTHHPSSPPRRFEPQLSPTVGLAEEEEDMYLVVNTIPEDPFWDGPSAEVKPTPFNKKLMFQDMRRKLAELVKKEEAMAAEEARLAEEERRELEEERKETEKRRVEAEKLEARLRVLQEDIDVERVRVRALAVILTLLTAGHVFSIMSSTP
ncbi:hypothetical protein EJ08DRAFT_395839 [Tothia fuscella]|uniref:Uncharacterized protein n=1 Tax=Tothia fuscella TaxID=1048955 RepID=A0A9P4NL46_9PEZI|nr:hypothetical protein EJ08DRAFT_395839 [Tothia fuscella]